MLTDAIKIGDSVFANLFHPVLFHFFVAFATSGTNFFRLFWIFEKEIEMSPSLRTLYRFQLSENRLSPAFFKQNTAIWADQIQIKKPLKMPISFSTVPEELDYG